MSSEGSIIYHRTPKSTATFAVLAIGFFLIGSWMVIGGLDGEAGLFARLAGLVSFLCFGMCAWLNGRRLKRKHRVYAVNHDGFSLAGPNGGWDLTVDWKEVQGVSMSDFGYGNVLTFAFRNPETIKARMSLEQRRRAEENEAAGMPTMTIPQSALDAPMDEVRNISARFFFGAG